MSSSTTTTSYGITENDVMITTSDGRCDAAFIHPSSGGPFPAVVMWSDAFGLRPSLRGIAKRLATEGFAVLVPNPFYRAGIKAPVFSPEEQSKLSFANTADRERIMGLMSTVNAQGAAERDSAAFLTWLDSQTGVVDPSKNCGVFGYCMGGTLCFRTAASLPQRFTAVGSFHSGSLVSQSPDSPHTLATKLNKATTLYAGIAKNDDEKSPTVKDEFRQALNAAGLKNEVEVIPAQHGWCMSDMPRRDGMVIYDEAQAERSFEKLRTLLKAT